MRSKHTEVNTETSLSFSIPKFQNELISWYRVHKSPHLWRQLWEIHRHPYPVWVSEIMLQQTTIASVTPVYERFMQVFPTLSSLACAKEEDIKRTVQGLGYYRRFSLLHKGAQSLLHGPLPQTYEQWLQIPGIGDYTAAALSSICFHETVPVIDGNVIRILARIFNISKAANDLSLKKEIKDLAKQLISKKVPGDFNQGLMELGQKICRPLNPSCSSCPLSPFCRAYKEGTTALVPQPKLRKKSLDVKLRLHIVESTENKVALFKRPIRAKFLKGSTGFFTEIKIGERFCIDGAEEVSPINLGEFLGTIKHNITHHRILVEVYKSSSKQLKQEKLTSALTWMNKRQIAQSLISSMDIKAWALYQKKSLKFDLENVLD